MEFDAVEAAVGAVAGGAAAKAVNPHAGEAGQAHHSCADCGTPVSGKFCSECGQPAHVHRTLLHLGHELLHGVMHFDGRIWRTLPLLIANPGKLTREWCEGKRARYVSPLAVFLFTLFIIFFGLTMAPAPKVSTNGLAKVEFAQGDAEAVNSQLAEMDVRIAEIDKELTVAEGGDRIALEAQKRTLAATRGALQSRLDAVQNPADDTASDAATGAKRADGLEPGSWQAQVADLKLDNNGHGIMAKIGKKLKNPDLMVYKLQQTAYKFAFLLVPFSIPFMWLLFLWRRGFTLYDHGVFVLYSLTFMLMLTVVAALLIGLVPVIASAVVWAVLAIVPVHMFAQLKGTYSLSIFSALWRTVLLLVFSSIVLSLFLVTIVVLGLGH